MSAIMLDLETLGTRPDCVILTVGAVKFDPFSDTVRGDNGLYFRINVDEQTAVGRTVQDDTLEWWSRQSTDVYEEAFGENNRVTLREMYQQLNRFLVGAGDIWCQGPVFDIAILENLYRQMSWPIPWNYWQIRDSRTLFGVHGDPRERNKSGLHNALEDCISQAQAVQHVYHQLGIKRT